MSSNVEKHASSRASRRVLASAAIGQFVEWYDFVVYAYTSSVLASLFFPAEDRTASLLATFGVYAVGFVMRPVGGIVFGHLGDRLGRRGVLAFIILLMGGSTAAIAVLPTYASIGLLAPVLLTTCRLLQGLSAGGEAIGSNTLVAEHAPLNRRGLWVGFTWAFAIPPGIFAALLILMLNQMLGEQAFNEWGWRIPFLIGGLMSLMGLYIRTKVQESPEFAAAKRAGDTERSPLLSIFRNHKKSLLLAFALAALSALGFYSLLTYFTSYLVESAGLSSSEALLSNSIALVVAFIVMTASGAWSDRVGRRKILIIGATLSVIVAVPGYALAGAGSLWAAIIGQTIFAAGLAVYFGPVGIAFLELFPTRTRYSGAAVAFNFSYVVFGGTAPLLGTWLVASTGSLLAPAFYTSALSLGVLIAVLFLPRSMRAPEAARQTSVGAEMSIEVSEENNVR